MTTKVDVADVTISVEDDGGICLMVRHPVLGWTLNDPYIAIIEAKQAFKQLRFDEKIGNYTSVISNENLAQYLGEAMIAWKGNQELTTHDGGFLIAATSTFVQFIHFRLGRDYMDYLDIEDEEAQSDSVNDKDAFVYMCSTKFFNLSRPEADGPQSATCWPL